MLRIKFVRRESIRFYFSKSVVFSAIWLLVGPEIGSSTCSIRRQTRLHPATAIVDLDLFASPKMHFYLVVNNFGFY